MDAIIDVTPIYLAGFLRRSRCSSSPASARFVLGMLVAAMRISPVPSLRMFATVYTECCATSRSPRPVLLRVRAARSWASGLDYLPPRADRTDAYTSPFVAEALRSGINGVPVGQAEAARSIGLGFGQTVSARVLPQAVADGRSRRSSTCFIALTKNTSVAGGFFVDRAVRRSRTLPSRDNGDAVHRDPAVGAALLPRHHGAARPHRRRASRREWRCCDERQCSLRRPRPEGPPSRR